VEERGGGRMILIINICKEKLHYLEFVKPIEDILKRENLKCFTKDYEDINNSDLKKADKVIICGTSLKDNEFIGDINEFDWIKSFEKPLFGICGGMQIIGLIFDGKIGRKTEIGYFTEDFEESFLGLGGKQEVYHLHNNFIKFSGEFEEFTKSRINQAVKHKEKEIYGVLFHPEVRQKTLITKFCAL
jgi:GMP synthase-like glutamine amidotransferase